MKSALARSGSCQLFNDIISAGKDTQVLRLCLHLDGPDAYTFVILCKIWTENRHSIGSILNCLIP